ncbi:RlpA-like double-psi beta-barrel-protein domain-containing protein-containing protein [Crucibulum laeve]|uniref:RlpA-like double-psi beta-barrel-protein domain-containing protein-containing protein n=1 Tax=Crucibulum laeve TaxID=68775 RepID=A0A5C3M8R2_9AGAR|nr:RlpA-like double-psi beta-barrel-protein domain-containing protein-containing protein [Crucibulum laeve]
MALIKSLVLILSAIASVSALATPHAARNSFHHRALAHRAPVPVPAPLNVPVAPLRKRANGKRCRQRPASSSAVAAPTTTTPVANAAPEPTVEKPTTTTAAQEKPTTTDTPATTPKPSPTTTKAVETPKPATTQANNSNLPSFMVGTQTGQGTFYGTGLGACGIVNTDADFIAAVSHLLFDTFPNYKGGNPNNNPICGRKVQATFQGKSVTVAITDRCEACALTDLDFSPTAFNQIADPALGRISGMKWVWL